jgi:hypothetical protein
MLVEAVAASPRRREVAFMFSEGTACCQFCVWGRDESEF